MPQTLHFEVLTIDHVNIEVGGEVKYHLRDDYGAERMLPFVATISRYQALGKQLVQAESLDPDDLQALTAQIEAMQTEVTHICGELFRHTYPGVTDEQIAAEFRFRDRLAIVTTFFSQAGLWSKTPPSATAMTVGTAKQPRPPRATKGH